MTYLGSQEEVRGGSQALVSRRRFLERILKLGSVGLAALVVLGASGCGAGEGEEDNGEEEDD